MFCQSFEAGWTVWLQSQLHTNILPNSSYTENKFLGDWVCPWLKDLGKKWIFRRNTIRTKTSTAKWVLALDLSRQPKSCLGFSLKTKENLEEIVFSSLLVKKTKTVLSCGGFQFKILMTLSTKSQMFRNVFICWFIQSLLYLTFNQSYYG